MKQAHTEGNQMNIQWLNQWVKDELKHLQDDCGMDMSTASQSMLDGLTGNEYAATLTESEAAKAADIVVQRMAHSQNTLTP